MSDPQATVETIVRLAEKARRKGLLALKGALDQLDAPLRAGIELVVEGRPAAEIRSFYEQQIDALRLARDGVLGVQAGDPPNPLQERLQRSLHANETAAELASSRDALYAQARGNATSAVLMGIAFAKARGESAAYVRFAGEQLAASGWDTFRGRGARPVARMAAVNLVSVGAQLVEFAGDEARAAVVVSDWPPQAALQRLGLTADEGDAFYDVWSPIAERAGLRSTWHRDGDQVRLEFTQP